MYSGKYSQVNCGTVIAVCPFVAGGGESECQVDGVDGGRGETARRPRARLRGHDGQTNSTRVLHGAAERERHQVQTKGKSYL